MVGPPETQIANGALQARLYLPDASTGFYRATRFDWSGLISSLRYRTHEYYAPWFQRMDPAVLDFIYVDDEIVAGPGSAVTGPAEEFEALGYNRSESWRYFLQDRRRRSATADAAAYQAFRSYEIVDAGSWTVTSGADWVQFQHELQAPSGHAYRYTKVVRLLPDRPAMVMEHRLENVGTSRIATNVYNHNFLSMDGHGTGAGITVSFPFALDGDGRLPRELAEISGKQVRYHRSLSGEDVAATTLRGFGKEAADYDIHVESPAAGAGVRLRGNRPLSRLELWSIRSVLGVEPYIAFSIEPHEEFTWELTFDFYELPHAAPGEPAG